MTAPQAVDDYSDKPGGFRQEWHCKPPDMSQSYRVLREEWDIGSDSQPVTRRIYGWEPLPKPIKPVPRWRRRLYRLLRPELW